MLTAVSFSATRTPAGERRVRRFALGRTCSHPGCATVLSAYNRGTTCYLHTRAKAPRLRGRPSQL